MDDELYEEYLVWLKETHNLTPEQIYCGVNEILELVALRDEFLGRMGNTSIVIMMKEDGSFEKQKKKIENSKWMVLTFEEYRNSKQK